MVLESFSEIPSLYLEGFLFWFVLVFWLFGFFFFLFALEISNFQAYINVLDSFEFTCMQSET